MPLDDDPGLCASNPADFAGHEPGWAQAPYGLAGVVAAYGAIQVQGGQIIAPRGWEAQHMTFVADLSGYSKRVYLNRAIVDPLRLALSRCVDLGDGYAIRTLGCFAPRPKRVNGDLSLHSWGVAVDLNADANPLADPGVSLAGCKRDIPDAWVAEFEAIGWTWGGRFKRPDPMHFQLAAGY